MKTLTYFCWVALLLPLFFSCQPETKATQEQDKSSTEMPAVKKDAPPVPPFNRDSAYAYVAKQVSFGPRVPNSDAHQACKEWLAAKLSELCASVIEQDFTATAYDGTELMSTNVIGQFNPTATRRIVLAAHWDSRPFADSPINTERRDEPVLGADDGASGVGVLLEVARQLGQSPIDIGVDIVFFDAEDYGESNGDNQESWGLGSQYWSSNLIYNSGNKPEYGILLDMVGAKGARFAKEAYSVYFARPVVNKIWKLAQQMGYGNHFVDVDGGGVTDDHYFVNTIARIPMIDIINQPLGNETSFVKHWHTHDDNMDAIDKRTLGVVGQLMLAVLYRENAGTI